MGDDGSYWLSLIILLLLGGYFAGTEIAFSSVSRVQIKSRADKGDARAKKAIYVLDNFDKAITTILIGNNIVHIAAATISTLLATHKWGVEVVPISTIVTTIVVFFASEMLPKSLAKKFSRTFALKTASSLMLLMKILTPVSFVLTAIGNGIAKLFHATKTPSVTEDELYDIIENYAEDGVLEPEKGELVQSALMFGDAVAEDVLTARVDVTAIDIEDDGDEILDIVRNQKHSRLPVYRDSIDNIIGVLQIRKYIKAYIKLGKPPEISSLLDEAFFVHQSMKIDELLQEMSKKKLNMAIVSDSYGGTLGIVTVEDILEELVGEIWDEDDEVIQLCVRLDGNRYELDAELTVEDAFDLIDFSDPDEYDFEHKLLGEWAYEQFDRIPSIDETFGYNGLKMTISKMERNRITKLTAELPISGSGSQSDADNEAADESSWQSHERRRAGGRK